jgi:hypothetical protein
MRNTTRRFLSATLVTTLPWFCGTALALPVLKEPQLQALMTAVSSEFEQHMAKPVAPAAPKESAPWPCAVPQADLDVFADTVDSDNNPRLKAELLNDARSGGVPPVKLIYTNKVVTLVRAKCEAGKLSGPIEFWMAYDMANSSTMLTMRYQQLVRVRANARDGKPEGMVLITGSSVMLKTTYADPELTQAMADAPEDPIPSMIFKAFTGPGPMPQAQVATSRVVVAGKASVITSTRFSRPDGLVVEDSYGMFGGPAHHFSRRHRRDGKLHGPEQSFGGMMGDTPTPPSTVCWQEGERILTLKCPSD